MSYHDSQAKQLIALVSLIEVIFKLNLKLYLFITAKLKVKLKLSISITITYSIDGSNLKSKFITLSK